MVLDETGHAIPFAADDLVIEAGANDPDFGPPESWPDWTDADRFEPSPADAAWLTAHPVLPPIAGGSPDDEPEPFEPTDADWDDFARWSGALTDEDIMAAGLSVG
jgi:hypothetical protein